MVSLSMGASVCFFAKSLYAGLICFLSGFLLDIDHIIEYIVHYGPRDLTIKNVYLACAQTHEQEGEYQFRKLYLIFHSTEIAIVLWVLALYTKNVYLFVSALGYSTHLILDYMGNISIFRPQSYFVIWRAINKFQTNKLLRKSYTK